MGFSNISVFWWEKIRHFVFKAEFENICYNISFWLKTKIARILKCVVKFVFGFSTFENSYSVFAKKNTQIEKRVAFNISRSSALLKTYFFFDNVFFFFIIWRSFPPPKDTQDFWKFEVATPHAFKLWLFLHEHKNEYYYRIELELSMLY